ncbi:MAG: hypothetical protein D6803_06300 [Anaerolineae bacterium]|nr:MAG: hypothetical protein D6803_06300 [Anaerolineae bacterium]
MRRGRIFFYLAAILLLLLVAGFVFLQRLNQPPPTPEGGAPEPTPVVDLVSVVIVTQPTPRGSVLDETMLGVVDLPRDVVFEGMFTDMALVVGRRAKFDLDAGIILTANMLVDQAADLSRTGSQAALAIPRGKLAMAVEVDRLSLVAYAPRPGDHVAVMASWLIKDVDSEFQSVLPNVVGVVRGPFSNPETGESQLTVDIQPGAGTVGRTELDPLLNELVYVQPSEAQRGRLVTQIILYDVEVLHVGEFLTPEEEEAQAAAQQAGEQQAAEGGQQAQPAQQTTGEQTPPPVVKPDIVTLIMNPQDAVALKYLINSGAQITLLLRASGDDTPIATEAVTLQYLFDVYNIPIPAKLPYAIDPRIDRLPLPGQSNQPAETTTP